MYNTDAKRKSIIFCKKKNIIFEISDFFSKGGPFDVKTVKNVFLIFQKFQNKNSTNDFHGTIQTLKGTKSRILGGLALIL